MTFEKLAGLKRRMRVGTRLICVENSKRPELNGKRREVVKVQTNGFYWTTEGDTRRCWTEYPKANLVTWVDDDTFRLALDEGNVFFVVMRFVAEKVQA